MRLINFGSVILPQLNGSQQLPVSFRSSVVPLRGGGFDQDGASSYPEKKLINATFWVSVNSVDDQVSDIDSFLDDLYAEGALGRRILLAKMRDGTLRQCEAKMLQGTTQPTTKLYAPDSLTSVAGYEPCNVSFEIVFPYWKAAEDTQKYLDEGWFLDDGIFLDSGNKEDATISGTTTLFEVNNTGAVAHQDTKLVITGGTGVTVTDITVENLTTGESLAWTGTIGAGEVLTINTLPQTIDKDSTGEYDNTTLPSTQLGFWSLAKGVNEFEITCTSVSGGTATLEFYWQRQYLR